MRHLRALAVPGWSLYRPLDARPMPADAAASARFLAARGDEAAFEGLFGYFLHGFLADATRDHARVRYPGLPSSNGYAISGLEGFARTAPLLAAWLHGGRPRSIMDGGRPVDLVMVLRTGILAGTDPAGPGYWGRIGDGDQRIVEAADIARLLWLTRAQIWSGFTAAQRAQVAGWLGQVDHARIPWRNNWLLFPVVVDAFLASVGERQAVDARLYMEFKRNLREDGWFTDGPDGPVDYYNVWGISYDLLWLHLMDPGLDPDAIEAMLARSAALTAHLLSPLGVPIMGRSLCYRTAVSVPLIAASLVRSAAMPSGEARRALDVTWRYFVSHRALRDFTLTMGYFETDPRLVDAYTGAGSCQWGLRSLILAFMAPPGDVFWNAPAVALPVEHGDYRLALPDLDWIIEGRRASLDIMVTIGRNAASPHVPQPYSWRRRLVQFLRHRPDRPENTALKYGLRSYDVVDPLGGMVR